MANRSRATAPPHGPPWALAAAAAGKCRGVKQLACPQVPLHELHGLAQHLCLLSQQEPRALQSVWGCQLRLTQV